MSSPGSEGEASDAPTEEGKVEMGEKGQGGARVSAGAAAAAAVVVGAEGSGEEAKRPAGQFVCCICMEPWTSYDAHRICCIPCGHVYGRSCLERWLHRCGELRAKCPQCSEPFALKNIVNLYAPGNMWDGCCHVQGLKAFINSEVAKVHAQCAEQVKRLEEFESTRLKEIESRVFGTNAELATVGEQMKNIEEMIKTKFVSMKEQMERLVEHNATPRDLMGFMEQNCTKLWDWIPNCLRQPIDS
ncbi:hypothetical protein EJB05_06421 [Eragrostis curvula]|uniref:RING-type domain-containing protein n=1 Tax=Eragrostis curvula TaxID=38414 RepID=A0A5J9WEY9_9POAL|nr:hypothetical protein EJB05_06421 [Eragrostis curvula]